MSGDENKNDSVDHFVQLFSKYQRRVHAYIGALVPSGNDADDVMQETSIALWKKWSTYDQTRSFLGWACGVAHIEVLRYRRRYSTDKLFFDEGVIENIAQEVLEQSDLVESRSKALSNCLERLGESDKTLIEYRYLTGMTTVRAADELNRPLSTVYKALTRIRGGLLDCIRRSLAQESAV